MNPTCPKCGSEMRKRNGPRGTFWGCSQFPSCRGSKNYNPADELPTRQELDEQRELAADIRSDPARREIADESERVYWQRLQEKSDFADRETAQEREGFASDPDYQKSLLQNKLRQIAGLSDQPAPAKTFTPSVYQQAIFDWVKTSQPGQALVVEALAGSGKTTTGVQMMNLLSPNQDIVFVAFNKHIATELSKKAPKFVKVCTYHSLGFSAVRQAFGNVQVDEDKTDRLIGDVLDRYTNKHLFPAIKQLVGLVKNTLSGTTVGDLNTLADYHGIELNGDAQTIFAAVQLVVERSMTQTNVIDFDDMCWLPIIHELPCKKYYFVFVDEAQDTNRTQIALALASLKDTGRIVAVGDRHQSLYGFRGADVDAIPNLIENLGADVLPLSITYRCPKAVVALVNQTFPEIPLEAADSAKPGMVREISYERGLMEYAPGDMVLCRTNAPLVGPAFDLIRRGVKAIIRGRDIGKGLTALIRKMKVNTLADLIRALSIYADAEKAKLLSANKNNQAQAAADKVDTIFALADGCYTISEVEDKIELIFSDTNAGVVFSSVHRAKGLEAERVFILHPELMPHPMAKKDWEQVQEQNIKYVAYTRSLNELVFVIGG